MLRMIIVDDETVIRQSLTDYVDWEAVGIVVVASCSNGIEAMEAIIDEMPDIVLTDIKMPGIDGLELIERTREMDLDIEYIVLSGYKEFEFAKKAMKYGVRNYLLKPISDNMLMEAVEEVKKLCRKKLSENESYKEKLELSRQVEEHRKRQMLYEIFSTGRNFADIVSNYPELQLNPQKRCIALHFTYLQESAFDSFPKGLYDILEKQGVKFFTDMLYVKNTAVIVIEDDERFNNEAVEHYSAAAEAYYWTKSYDNMDECLAYVFSSLTRYPNISTIDKHGNSREVYNAALSLDILKNTISQLLGAWEIDATDKVSHIISSFLDPMESVDSLRVYGANILSMLTSELLKVSSIKVDIHGVFDNIYSEKNSEELKALITKQVMSMLTSSKKQESRSTIEKVIMYIDNNLAEQNLSLKLISEKYAHMNTDYLGRLFLQETGERFSHYLNRKRIDKAKQLLVEEDEGKIYLVAEQVGCGHNPRYFNAY